MEIGVMDQATELADRLILPGWAKQTISRNNDVWEASSLSERPNKIEAWSTEIRSRLGNLFKDPPQVSIVIPARNEEKHLLQVLDTISRQSYSKGIEVIVVTNNCTDNSAELAKKCGVSVVDYTLAPDNPNKKHSPIAYARQIGLENSHGRFLISADADSLISPHFVETQIAYLESHPQVSCVTGEVDFYDHARNPKLLIYDIARFLKRNAQNILSPGEARFARGANMVMRTEQVRDAGGFEPRIYPGEDAYMAKSLGIFGKTALNHSPDALVWVSSRRIKDLKINSIALAQNSQYFDQQGNRVPEVIST